MKSTRRIVFERVLCPTDLSPDSNEALAYAVALAHAYGARLIVCYCAESDRPGVEEGFKAAVQAYADRMDYAAWEPLIIDGDPVVAINKEAAERDIDLIVMTSRRRPHAAALMGSTAESICRSAPCPVLVTHPREHDWTGVAIGEVRLKRILAALDFSDDSELALSYALSLAEEYQAELHLMHVLPSLKRAGAPELSWMTEGVESAFDRAARTLRSAVPSDAYLWCDIKHVVMEGHPYRVILSYAAENDVDLICMGVHGAGFGMRALFGSNVDRVLRQAPCPTFIARPLKPAQRSEK